MSELTHLLRRQRALGTRTCLAAFGAVVIALASSSARAADENEVRSFLSVDREFHCDLQDLGAFHEGYDVGPEGTLTLSSGGSGIIGSLHLEVGDAEADYRFGSSIDIENGIAMIESNLGSPVRTSGQLEPDTQWPFLSADMVLQLANPASLDGTLKSTNGTAVNVACEAKVY